MPWQKPQLQQLRVSLDTANSPASGTDRIFPTGYGIGCGKQNVLFAPAYSFILYHVRCVVIYFRLNGKMAVGETAVSLSIHS